LQPGACWSDEQVETNGSIVKEPNGVRGVGIPIRFTRTPDSNQDARSAAATPAQGDLPLKGLKVVGLGAYIAGPAASRPLADLGADVIKVDPLSGDPSTNTYHHYWACNAGKRSIRINLKTPEGIALLQQLCGRADVVHHNFRRGVVDRFGIDPETLRKRPAPVVTLRCDAYGVTGPKADYPGFDQIALGITGHEVRAGGVGNAPLWYRNCIADYTAAMLGSLGILIGLFERNHSGASVDAQVNLLDSGLYLMSELIQNPDGSFAGAPGNDAEQLGVSATERIYAVRNGWIAIATRGAAMSAALLQALGLPADLFARDDAQVARSIGEKLQARRLDDALELFQKHGVWSEACRNLEGATIDRDPAAVTAGLVYHVEDPAFGHVAATGPSIKLSAVRARYSPRAPHLGENSSAIMSELGYSKETIEEYLKRSIVS
jgi:crotonobetainyl-CoA:carnitine CoA-transferase CaiB-like acyl-CoA transferase